MIDRDAMNQRIGMPMHQFPRFRELPYKRKPDPVVAVVPKSAMMDKGIAFVVDLLADAAKAQPI